MRINSKPEHVPRTLLTVFVNDVMNGAATVFDPTTNSIRDVPLTELTGGVRPRRGEWWITERIRGVWFFVRQVIPPELQKDWVGQLLDLGTVVDTDPLRITIGDSRMEYSAVNASGQTLSDGDAVVIGGIKTTWYVLGVLP